MMTKPKAYIFDVFGTVVDWRNSIAREVQASCADKNLNMDYLAFADYWRGRYQPAMERIRSGDRGYVSLDQLHFENLVETLEEFGAADAFSEDERRSLNSAWEKLTPWDDVVLGLTKLKQKAIIAPCSNGSIALMTRLSKFSALPWDCILGADIAQNYKPNAQVYHACCDALRLQPNEVMMVAAHNDDLAAAQTAGLQTCFIPRVTEYGEHQAKDFEASGDWDKIITKFDELAG